MSTSKFHISLNVRDLTAATAFFESLFDVAPSQRHGDYAKFDLADPPLVLSLVPTDVPPAAAAGAGLNHLGFRLPTHEALDGLQQRLARAGIAFDREQSVACCHSRQTKCWVYDPAGNLWEFYALEAETDCTTPGIKSLSNASNPPSHSERATPSERATWSHRLGMPFPESIPAADGTLDEVVLEGTFNESPSVIAIPRALAEAARVLRSGGRLLIRGLTADGPLTSRPRLPGPGALVAHVPTAGELLAAVTEAGFVGAELTTFGETYSFQHAEALLRETRLQAYRACGADLSRPVLAIYRGPFAELKDDSGLVLRRGEPIGIDEPTWRRLRESSNASQFVFILAAEVASISAARAAAGGEWATNVKDSVG